jgi:hypothetical protein
MTKKYIIIAIVVLVVVVGGWFLLYGGGASGGAAAPYAQIPASSSSPQASSTAVFFSSSQYAKNAYLISATGTYDAATQKALDGFQVNKQVLSDGSLQIQLVALKSEYATQSYVVKPGEKLYFIESFAGDDSTSEDRSPGDDRAILVDAAGYIL